MTVTRERHFHRHHPEHRRPHHAYVGFVLLRITTTKTGRRGHGMTKEYLLHPNIKEMIMGTVNVGHTDTLGIEYLDQNGNPMLTPVTPDSPPTWTDAPSVAGIDTFTPA